MKEVHSLCGFDISIMSDSQLLKRNNWSRPTNAKFNVGDKLKIYAPIRMSDGTKKETHLNIQIKYVTYSPSLRENYYNIILLDTTGKIEKLIAESELEKIVVD